MAIPPFDAQQPIPNNPFNNPDANRYNLSYPTGQLVFGDYLFVDYTTGNVYISPNPPNNGTVQLVTAGAGLATTPVSGIVSTGSIGLKAVPTLVPGTYTYPTITINNYGKLTLAVDGITPLVTLTGTTPIKVTGSNPNLSLGILNASTSQSGATQLEDSLTSQDSTKALTAQQGYNLGLQMSYVGSAIAGKFFAGTINTATGNVAQLTPDGAPLPGVSVGSPLPSASAALNGAYFQFLSDGVYTPPGGVATAVVKGDEIHCIDGAWQIVLCGQRLVPASTTVYGTTILSTPADVLPLTEPNKVVTPGSLSVMVASETQVGFVELTTDAETQAFTDNTRAVTSKSLGTLQATTNTCGLVMLSDSTSDTSVTNAPTSNALTQYASSTLNKSFITARGDLVVGLDFEQPIILPLGPNNSVLVVDDTKTAIGGLDWSVREATSTWPVGSIIWNLSTTIPPLWLPCDGRLLDGDINGPYFDLYDLIGTTYNTGGEPAGFFRLPDLRGMFVRGWSGANGGSAPATALDPGRVWVSTQQSAYKQHDHGITDPGHAHAFPLTEHTHTSNAGIVKHSHDTNNADHCHSVVGYPNAEVVGDQAGFYDGNGQWGAPTNNYSLKGRGPLINVKNLSTAPVTQADGTYTDVAINGGSGVNAKATVVVVQNIVVSVTVTNGGFNYSSGDTNLTLSGAGYAGFTMAAGTVNNGATTGVALNTQTTSIVVNSCVTGITQANNCVTGIVVNNSPLTVTAPDESRPFNIALLPIIKYSGIA